MEVTFDGCHWDEQKGWGQPQVPATAGMRSPAWRGEHMGLEPDALTSL